MESIEKRLKNKSALTPKLTKENQKLPKKSRKTNEKQKLQKTQKQEKNKKPEKIQKKNETKPKTTENRKILQ